MTVNNYMDKFNDIFIAEMGAYVKGEIKGLCKLVKPKYGILTRIGTAHLESFGSEENIVSAKFELIESLPSDGFAILNGDDPKQVGYKLKNKVKTIIMGDGSKEQESEKTSEQTMPVGESKFAEIYGKAKGGIKKVFEKIKSFIKGKSNDKNNDEKKDDRE